MAAKVQKLTFKQQKFVEFYKGNGTEAARLAGYKGNDVTLGAVGTENLKKPLVAEAIKKRNMKTDKSLIATREDRQKFWSEVMQSGDIKMAERLKASELLGKSEIDFTEKHQISGPNDEPVQVKWLD